MDVWFGTVIRAAPVQRGGSLVKLDWDRKRVVREVPIVPSEPSLDHDPNERGNVRGCRHCVPYQGRAATTTQCACLAYQPSDF